MSLTSPEPTADGIVITAVGERCFFCGEPTRDPALLWMGSTGPIFVHPSCFPSWVARMFSDYLEWDRRTR